jgi:hypothetical protein
MRSQLSHASLDIRASIPIPRPPMQLGFKASAPPAQIAAWRRLWALLSEPPRPSPVPPVRAPADRQAA